MSTFIAPRRSRAAAVRSAAPFSGGVVVDELQLRRVLHPQLACRHATAGTRAQRSGRRRSARAAASSPSTLTNTCAWRRSGLVSTAVTVTKPTRGSLMSLIAMLEHLAHGLVDSSHPFLGHRKTEVSLPPGVSRLYLRTRTRGPSPLAPEAVPCLCNERTAEQPIRRRCPRTTPAAARRARRSGNRPTR